MNNFRNPYVDPDSFQGKVYDYYKNQTNPNSTRISRDNQGGFEKRENQQSRKNNEYDKTKKHSLYKNSQFEKTNDSKPVMFSPPKVDSIEKPLNENTSDELSFNIAPDKNEHIKKKGRKEVVSNLIKEFSLMLDDTPSIQEGFTILQEDELENVSLLNSGESTSIPENHVHTIHENSEQLFDEFHPMLDEHYNHLIYDKENIESLNENTDTMEDKFFIMLSESDELQEEKQESNTNEVDVEMYNDTIENKFFIMYAERHDLQEEKPDSNTNEANIERLNENTDTMEDKFLKMLSESDELQEEMQGDKTIEADIKTLDEETDTMKDKFSAILPESAELQKEKQDSSFTKIKEMKPGETGNFSKEELQLCHKKPYIEKKKKYWINKNNPFQILCFKGIEDEQFFKKNTHFIEQKKTITVKVPVLLTRLNTDIDIVETIDLLMPLYNILKVEWSVQSLDCKVVLPSKTVFLKGIFIAEIVFSNIELENKIQTLRITIPWEKIENAQWLSVPEIPDSNQKEFIFQPQHEHDSNYHYEAYQKFAEPIQSQLKKVHFVWHQEIHSTEKQLQVNGVAQLSIHCMQEQFVELDCYSK